MTKTYRRTSDDSRLVVIGLDGATYDVLVPLAQMGVMPNLARLMQNSALAELNSTEPYITPVAWTTFLTGCDPACHGILDYRYYDHVQGKLLMNHAGRIPCRTLFDSIVDGGGQVVSLNLPMTHPARQAIPGIVVGGLDSPSIEAALAPYPKLAGRLQAGGTHYDLKTIWKRAPLSFEELSEKMLQTKAAFRGRVEAARIADELVDWQFLLVHFQTLDSVFHRLWPYLGIGSSRVAPATWVKKTHEAFRVLDEAVGELLEMADRARASVAVLSDHGFGPLEGEISLAELFRQRGLVTPASFSSHVRSRSSRLYHNFRKWLTRKLHPGRSTASLSRSLYGVLPINWQKSVAVAPHGNLAALVYLNTRQRFGTGPLATERNRDQAAAEVTAALREARHPETGEPLFEDVYRTEERFGCDPLERMLPDVVGIPAPGFHTRHRFHPKSKLIAANPSLPATHRKQGVLLVHSPAAVTGGTTSAEMRDVAPTILHLLGLSAEPSMQGRVLDQMLLDYSPRRQNMSRDSHNPVPPPHYTSADEAAIADRLRELGYLD